MGVRSSDYNRGPYVTPHRILERIANKGALPGFGATIDALHMLAKEPSAENIKLALRIVDRAKCNLDPFKVGVDKNEP